MEIDFFRDQIADLKAKLAELETEESRSPIFWGNREVGSHSSGRSSQARYRCPNRHEITVEHHV